MTNHKKIVDLYRDAHKGFSDNELNSLLTVKRSCIPELYWPLHIYSLSHCYRLMISNWPTFAPLPFFTDHGVDLRLGLQSHDLINNAYFHLAWGDYRIMSSDKLVKKVFICCNPWVFFRRSNGIELCSENKGTLVFFPHSNDQINCHKFDVKKYVFELGQLPAEYHPIVYCLHSHDINGFFHNKLRMLGCSIVSAGNNQHEEYILRFYNLIRNFEFATSPNGNTDLFLSHEAGLKYFIFGDRPIFESSDGRELGPMQKPNPVSHIDSLKVKLFLRFPPELSADKDDLVSFVLGTEMYNNKINIYKIMGFRNAVMFGIEYLVFVFKMVLFKFFSKIKMLFRDKL